VVHGAAARLERIQRQKPYGSNEECVLETNTEMKKMLMILIEVNGEISNKTHDEPQGNSKHTCGGGNARL
jgi:hypothetical protein